MLNLKQITEKPMQTRPYAWAEVGNLFSARDAAALAASYPHDHFKTVEGYGGEKDYCYEARALIPMGKQLVAYASDLSDAWQSLAHCLLSKEYRAAMSTLTGYDLSAFPVEANVYHYGPGAHLGPHRDLPEKIVVHILYFNEAWKREDGGYLSILNSQDANDVAAYVEPVVGNSAVLVRSENSWHEVTRVSDACRASRRSVTVTFYQPGSVSPMWRPEDESLLHYYGQSA